MFGNNTNPSSITFNPTTSKYSVTFAGKTIETTLTDKSSVADKWVRQILSIYAGKPMVVGLDIEWRPPMNNKTATLQLCIDDKCLILQLIYMDEIPESLKSFLGDSNFTFVGVEVGNDIGKLNNEYGLKCSRVADIRDLAMQRWPGRFQWPGLKELAFEVANLVMEKPRHIGMSDWAARVLNDSQIEYACIDAYASYKVGHKLIIETKGGCVLL